MRTTLNVDDEAMVSAMRLSPGKTSTCGIVVAELIQGLRRDKPREAIRRSFEELTFLEPSGIPLYLRAAEVYRMLRRKGRTVRSTIDCVVAGIAEEHGCYVPARDRDMDAILESGLVKARPWPAASPPG